MKLSESESMESSESKSIDLSESEFAQNFPLISLSIPYAVLKLLVAHKKIKNMDLKNLLKNIKIPKLKTKLKN
jgi:hypothetical protein